MKKRIISTLLAVVMLLSTLTLIAGAEEASAETFVPEYNTKSNVPTLDYMTGEINKNGKGTGEFIQTPADKLETMDLRLEKDGYRLYVDAYSGEVAVECIATGEVLFSNPYDIGTSKATDDIKSELMSQISIDFTDIISGDEETYWSYEWAASRGQIIVKNIKGGIRVEYTIGREEAKLLVPECIERSSFETQILNVVKKALTDDDGEYSAADDFTYKKLTAYYSDKFVSEMTSQATITETQKAYPITKKMDIYVLDSATTSNEKAKIEQIIKTYCPNYSYENLDEDHLKTEWESEDENPPLFKLALEYNLDANGMTVRLPANGIRFSESLFRLDSITILPYMGAGSNPNQGYTFFPDGSGTIFDFEECAALGTSTTVTGKLYGDDYAYHETNGMIKNQETLRYPVFGVYENQELILEDTAAEEIEGEETPAPAAEDADDEATEEEEVKTYFKKRGYVAIVEEGDAMMDLTVSHAIRTHEYNTVMMTVYPRPKDSYNIADAISVGQNDTWTVVSSRKYTGSYKVRYIMLTDPDVAAEKDLKGTYETSYVGMAKAYRDYLASPEKGVLTKLTDTKSDIPLYIETFGAMETTERYLSIPFDVMTPLTTFADINTMYDELAADGITNVNFILTGYTKGGLTNPKAPYKLKWEGAVEDGGMKFEDLNQTAKDKGFQIFPDFDFVFVQGDHWFDGVDLGDHAVKTIDDRYASKREYSATKQTFISYYELALSPAYFSHFYEKFTESFKKYDPQGISVSTLGTYLTSDFDEEEPFNREDGKNFTVKAFEFMDQNYSKVMTSGGNAYSWKYVDYITDIALDSSRYAQSAAAVPFLGIVLHGYVEYAGTAINMEGNVEYAMLKALESGAALKFILSYRNTDNLKNSIILSHYYSVRYDIWRDDVIELYNELNSALKDLQTSTIEVHKFLNNGTRIPDNDELELDNATAIQQAIKAEEAAIQAAKDELRRQLREARQLILDVVENMVESKTGVDTDIAELEKYKAMFDLAIAKQKYDIAKTEYDEKAADAEFDESAPENVALKANVDTLKAAYDAALAAVKAIPGQESFDPEVGLGSAADTLKIMYDLADKNIPVIRELIADYEATDDAIALLEENDAFTKLIRDELKSSLDDAALKAAYADIAGTAQGAQSYEAKILAIVTDAYNAYAEAYPEDTETKAYEAPAADEESDDENVEDNTEEEAGYDKYKTDSNKIVYMEYHNSDSTKITEFLLNFNNYSVIVQHPNTGVYYTIEAYGYVILKSENA